MGPSTSQRRPLTQERHCVDCVALQFAEKERIRKRIDKTWALARAGIFDYIEVFNNWTDATAISAASVQRPSSGPVVGTIVRSIHLAQTPLSENLRYGALGRP